MNRLRLFFQHLLSTIAIPLRINYLFTQFCDRCGRSDWGIRWWDDTYQVWEAVAGNVNDQHHGCYCPTCFTILARNKGIVLIWKPVIEEQELAARAARAQEEEKDERTDS